MSDSDRNLADVIMALKGSIDALNDVVVKLYHGQTETAKNVAGLADAMEHSVLEILDAQMKLGEAVLGCFRELSEKLGVSPPSGKSSSSFPPSSSSTPQQGGGKIQ